MATLSGATTILSIAALLAAVPSLVLLIEVAAAFLPPRNNRRQPVARPRLAMLIPAHDEARALPDMLRAVQSQMAPGDRLVVVADNCSDDTQSVAAACGAEVVSRTDAERRGKCYALAHGIRYLSQDAPEVVIIIDADCRPGPDCLPLIGGISAASGKPVQAHYELDPPRASTPYTLITSFAWKVKCYVRPLGLHRLRLPCQLSGSGMAFPWSMISGVNLESGELAEDLVLGLDLARAGAAPLFCPEAHISSPLPGNAEGQKTQRQRWETGHLQTIARHVPPALFWALRRGDPRLLVLALDAAVPPLALFSMITIGTLIAAFLYAVIAGPILPLGIAGASLAMLTCAVLLAWWKAGRDVLRLGDLAMAPAYAFAKIPLYGQIFRGKRLPWIRSKRD